MFVNPKLERIGSLTGSKTSLTQLHSLRICDISREEKLKSTFAFSGGRKNEETHAKQMDDVKYVEM